MILPMRALAVLAVVLGAAPAVEPVDRALARAGAAPSTARVFQAGPARVLLGVPTAVRGPATEGQGELRVLAYDARADRITELLPAAGLAREVARGLLAVEGDELRLHDRGGVRTLLRHAAPDFAVDRAERFVAIAVRRAELPLDTDLVLVPLAGGPARTLVAWTGSAESRPVFTPDGRAVIFVSGASGCASLYRVELSGGGVRQLTNVGLARPGPATIPPPPDAASVRWEGETLVYETQGQVVRVAAGAAR